MMANTPIAMVATADCTAHSPPEVTLVAVGTIAPVPDRYATAMFMG